MEYKHQLPQELTETNKSIYGEESSGMKDFVVGAVVGGIIGAAVALLYAPKSGADLRSDVAKNASQLKEKSVELSSVAKEKTVHLSTQLKDQSTQIVEKVKSKTSKSQSADEEEADVVVELLDEVAKEVTPSTSEVAESNIDELLQSNTTN